MIEFLYIYLFIAVILGLIIVIGIERYKGEILSNENEYKAMKKMILIMLSIILFIVISVVFSTLFKKP